jgi:hypothetical protein
LGRAHQNSNFFGTSCPEATERFFASVHIFRASFVETSYYIRFILERHQVHHYIVDYFSGKTRKKASMTTASWRVRGILSALTPV